MGNETTMANEMLPRSAVVEDVRGTHEIGLQTIHMQGGKLFVTGGIDMPMSNRFASAMLHLSADNRPVDIYINSHGGMVDAGLMMYDIIQSYKGEVNIYCMGLAASMAAVLLAGGQKGRRFILPHSRVMIHEPLIAGGMGGSATTIEKTAKNILDVKKLINGILAKHTGRSIQEVDEATAEDNYMDAHQAIEFGICDEIRSIF